MLNISLSTKGQRLSEAYTKREAMVSMRDGVRLYTAVYEPNDKSRRHPILMFRTPYGCNPYGKSFSGALNNQLKHYVAQRYIIVQQDVRGRYMSEGEYENVRPVALRAGERTNDVTDAYDTVEWLLKNTRNNGSVGLTGSSYLGYYAITAALCQHPAIKAVCPQAPIGDWFMGDDIRHNGALMLTDAFRFLWGFGRYRGKPSPKVAGLKPYYTTDEYSFFLDMGTIANLSTLQRDSLPFWDAMLAHPNYDEWWQQRSPLKHYAKITIPVMVVGGLFDAEDAYGTWATYKALAARPNKAPLYLLIGPWKHGGWHEGKGNRLGDISFGDEDLNQTFRTMQQRFFDYYLMNEGKMTLSPLTLFFTGENQWRTFTRFPTQNTIPTPLYLHIGGKLSFDQPYKTRAYTQYGANPSNPVPYTGARKRNRDAAYMVEDQRFVSDRGDVLSFVTPPLTNPITLCGPIAIDLCTSISTTDADYVVKLIDAFPNDENTKQAGYEMLVRGDIMRGRYRNSFSNPEPFVPNKVEHVRFSLVDVAHTFKKGHRIMVQIQSSWFPLADRNPQQFVDINSCKKSDFVKCQVRVYHDAANTSKLLLPVLAP